MVELDDVTIMYLTGGADNRFQAIGAFETFLES